MKFTIMGEPCGKARPRVVRNNGISRSYTPEKTTNYEALVKMIYRQQHGTYIVDGPVRVRIAAYYSVPRSASKRKAQAMRGGALRPTKKPDCDNIAKIICDALNGIAFKDDAQVSQLYVEKWYADEPRVEVEIRPMNQGAALESCGFDRGGQPHRADLESTRDSNLM